MRLTTLYRYQQIVKLYNRGKREPKKVAAILHIGYDVVCRALRIVSHETPTESRRRSRTYSQNFTK